MGTWLSKMPGEGMTACEPSDEIEKAFAPVFIRHVPESHLQCQVTA